jgi:hypothetical protein
MNDNLLVGEIKVTDKSLTKYPLKNTSSLDHNRKGLITVLHKGPSYET